MISIAKIISNFILIECSMLYQCLCTLIVSELLSSLKIKYFDKATNSYTQRGSSQTFVIEILREWLDLSQKAFHRGRGCGYFLEPFISCMPVIRFS